jgi:hypothetical protein
MANASSKPKQVTLSGDKTVFQTWIPEDVRKIRENESFTAKIWRQAGRIAGLERYLGPADYAGLLAKFETDDCIKREYLPKNAARMSVTKIRNNTAPPFDLYTLIKKGSRFFILGCCVLYFLIISATFSLISSEAISGCYDTTASNFLTKGFLLVSGLGSERMEQTDTCLWIECFGTLIGVYLSLPIIGAIALVRLLDNAQVCFSMSNNILLGYRKGRPIISVRTMSSTGELYTNRIVHCFFAVKNTDFDTGENYGENVVIEMPYLNLVQPFGMASTYCIADDNDILVQSGVVKQDDKGRWKWNHSKIVICWYTVSVDKDEGSRTVSDTRLFVDTEYHLIDCDDVTGAYPLWKSCSPSTWFSFVPTKGTTMPVSDLLLLSDWEYSPKMVNDYNNNANKQINMDTPSDCSDNTENAAKVANWKAIRDAYIGRTQDPIEGDTVLPEPPKSPKSDE